jgi:hypothetical protein
LSNSDVTKQTASELIGEIYSLSVNYALWLQLVYPDNQAHFSSAMSKGKVFFEAIAESLFQAIAVSMYLLLDERDDCISIYQLIKSLRNSHPALANKVSEMLRPDEEIFDRMRTLRHKVYGHRDGKACPETIFRALSLTPELIGRCVSLLEEIMDTIGTSLLITKEGEVIIEAERCSDSAQEGLIQLLESTSH